MPQMIGSLLNGKPIVEVAITQAPPFPGAVAPRLDAASFPVRHYMALIDTGADITCVCDHVVYECGLRSYGLANLIGGNGGNKHSTHIISLGIFCEDHHDFDGEPQIIKSLFQLPNPIDVVSIRDNSWFDVIIGTDILINHEFRLTRGGGFVLELF